jgi:hypothetical protein
MKLTPSIVVTRRICRRLAQLMLVIVAGSALFSSVFADQFASLGPKLKPGSGIRDYKSPVYVAPCGAQGQSCCRAPAALQVPALAPLVACKQGLGCDVGSNTCVAPCGGNDQVCCDGPDTRALKWTPDGKVFSPNSPLATPMCAAGACDRASHRCFICGNADGARCCPPDAAQATARCVGERLSCKFDSIELAVSGVCIECGVLGRAPCSGGVCDPGLGIRQALCAMCGSDGRPPCDAGCQSSLGIVQGVCRACGASGQPPCDSGCRSTLGILAGRCAPCGLAGQPACDKGCTAQTRAINGVCVACGKIGQSPCVNAGGAPFCSYPLRPTGGQCRSCGAQGEIACDSGCNSGLTSVSGICQRPSGADAAICAGVAESCVPRGRPGIQCCGDQSLMCLYGQCRRCVRSGEECVRGGPQLCCNPLESCRLQVDADPQGKGLTEKVTCGIPD